MNRAVLAAALAATGLLTLGATTSGASHVPTLRAAFADNPLTGGQVAPRSYRWVNGRTSVFVQFDNPREPRALRYVGISVKGTFCAESQPRGPKGGFTHFHRLDAPTYAQGHGGPPGTQGYWLLWVAVDDFATADGRQVAPGVDYAFSPTPPPGCGDAREPSFDAPGAHRLSRAELRALARLFPDQAVAGPRGAVRRYRWVTGDTAVFIELDRPSRARAVRYVGVAKRGVFCGADRPTADFAAFEPFARVRGDRRPRRGAAGLWHLGVAVDAFRMPWGRVRPGVDHEYYAARTPNCRKRPVARGRVAATVRLAASGDRDRPFAFSPAQVTVPAGSAVRWVNGGDVFHTVTSTAALEPRQPSGLFDHPLPRQGERFEFTFARPGVYHYYCRPHSDFMWGTVRVTG